VLKKFSVVAPTLLGLVAAGVMMAPPSASAFAALPCDPKGVPAADAWNASLLAPSLNGRMTGGLWRTVSPARGW
jgi:hypothetical protein